MKKAFIMTVPVMFGYLFAGAAYGLLLYNAGYGVLWALLTSTVIYAGTMQYVLITFLTGGVSLPSIIITSLALQSRHIFYGLSFIEKFKSMGRKRPYMVFSLTDETYSLLCLSRDKGEEDDRLYFTIAWMNQLYWIAGGALGSLLGSAIPFDTTGVDFAMTALFVVIFMEQWLSGKNRMPAVLGLICGIFFFRVLGGSGFILPALTASVLLLLLFKKNIERKEAAK